MLVRMIDSIIIWLLIRLCSCMCGFTIQMYNGVLALTYFWKELNCWKSVIMDYAGFWNRVGKSLLLASFSNHPGEVNWWIELLIEMLYYLTRQWPRIWQEWSNHLSSVFPLVQAWSTVAKDGGQICIVFFLFLHDLNAEKLL